jgi:hypothetical protein
MTGCSVATWKIHLDKFLELAPDQPIQPGYVAAPCNSVTAKSSNSLPDWVHHLRRTDREFSRCYLDN